MPKSDIHPKWFKDTPVLFDGKRLFVSSTKPELQVDMWLANHPFYKSLKLWLIAKVELKFMKNIWFRYN
jgi:ribosomal protein L31